MTSPRELLETLEGAKLCRQALKGKKELGLWGCKQEGIARRVRKRQAERFHADWSWSGGRSGFWEETGKRGFQVEEVVEAGSWVCIQGLPHCREDSHFWK